MNKQTAASQTSSAYFSFQMSKQLQGKLLYFQQNLPEDIKNSQGTSSFFFFFLRFKKEKPIDVM